MANRGRGGSNRGRARGRPYSKGPLRAASHANSTYSPNHSDFSQHRNTSLPAEVNNTKTSALNLQPGRSPSHRDPSSFSPVVSAENLPNGISHSIPSQPESSSQTPGIEAPSSEVGDNGPSGQGGSIPPLERTSDTSIPSPSVHLVLEELRDIKQQVSEIKEIKQQMSKLDQIQSVTGSLADKLTGVMDRTSKLETAVHSTPLASGSRTTSSPPSRQW